MAIEDKWEELKFPKPECGECRHWDGDECVMGSCIYTDREPKNLYRED